MRHRPASPHRAAAPRPLASLAALAALAWLAGCTGGPGIAECPGLEVAVLDLLATRASAACQGDTVPADADAACAARTPPVAADCRLGRPVPACCFDRLFAPEVKLRATFAYGSLDDSAALCLPRPGASPYLGRRATVAGGDQLTLSLETVGAVLASCSSTCAVTVHHEVTGLLARDPVSGAVTGFTGASVEGASPTPDATCTPCTAPCTATWTLALAPPPAP